MQLNHGDSLPPAGPDPSTICVVPHMRCLTLVEHIMANREADVIATITGVPQPHWQRTGLPCPGKSCTNPHGLPGAPCVERAL